MSPAAYAASLIPAKKHSESLDRVLQKGGG
jgi:hypothetical protein